MYLFAIIDLFIRFNVGWSISNTMTDDWVESSQLKRLKKLKGENRRLKHMYAELSIDHEILKEVIGKKL